MIRAFILGLLLCAFGAQAAAPSVTCTPSVTSGTAPLGVIVNCSATTDPDTAKPFHDLFYETTFGDLSAGAWANGANTSQSKNYATGPIVAHVYETAGTFTITTTVTDGTSLVRVTNTITVTAANTTFTTGNTKCFYQTSASGDCPNGGSETLNTDFDSALSGCIGTNKRCLWQRGSTFTADATNSITATGPAMIGAYGSGALPVINISGNVQGLRFQGASDIRVMDLEIAGTGSGNVQRGINITTTSVDKLTILRLTIHDTGAAGILLSSGTTVGTTNSVLQENTVYNTNSESTVYIDLGTGGAILGNLIGPVGTNEHSLRVARAQNSVIANNTIKDPASGRSVTTIRAFTHASSSDDSFNIVVSDNKFMQGTRAVDMLAFEPNDNVTDQRLYDFIVERNWFLTEAYTGSTQVQAIRARGVRGTIRNNLFDLSGPTTATRYGVFAGWFTGTEPAADDINVYNNTFYMDPAVTATARGTRVETRATNTILKNNLCWMDNGTACVQDLGTGTTNPTQPTAGGNSSTSQTTSTNPSFDTPLTAPVGFRVGTGSYAASGGVAIFPATMDDFFHCDDTTSNERLGAFVPRVRTKCKGSAGP